MKYGNVVQFSVLSPLLQAVSYSWSSVPESWRGAVSSWVLIAPHHTCNAHQGYKSEGRKGGHTLTIRECDGSDVDDQQ